MSTAIAMLAVGLVSYVFRVVPLLTVGRLRLGPSVLRTIRHGGAAAVTALFVTALGGGSSRLVGPGADDRRRRVPVARRARRGDAAHRAVRRNGICADRRGRLAGSDAQLVTVDLARHDASTEALRARRGHQPGAVFSDRRAGSSW